MKSGLTRRVILYNLFLCLAIVPGLPWAVWQLISAPRRRAGLLQRCGLAPRGRGRVVWVHAVSVGEVMAALPMLARLKEGLGPGDRLFLSTVTLTGQETARRECPWADAVFYFPFDLLDTVFLALHRVRPAVFVTMETELWPNFLAACHYRGIPVVVANGRISDRSFGRYRRFRWFMRPFLERVRAFLMQSGLDARRIVDLGAPPPLVTVTGNVKYDRSPGRADLPAGIRAWADGFPVLTAGSTHEGEEKALLDSVRDPRLAGRRLRLVLAPRHPERFDAVEALLRSEGIAFDRYSRLGGEAPGSDVLLVDGMGLLEGFYSLATVAFVGGSLAPVGGHNLLEPAMLGKPVLTGPHTENFRDITETLTAAGGAKMVPDGAALAETVAELLDDEALRKTMGEKARLASEKAAGASARNARAVLDLLKERQ